MDFCHDCLHNGQLLHPRKAQDRFESPEEVAKDGYDAMLPSLPGMLRPALTQKGFAWYDLP